MSPSERTPESGAATRCELREIQTAIALRHIRVVPETQYGAEVCKRLAADVRDLVIPQRGKDTDG